MDTCSIWSNGAVMIILRENGFGQKIWIIVQISLMNSRALILNHEYRSLRGRVVIDVSISVSLFPRAKGTMSGNDITLYN